MNYKGINGLIFQENFLTKEDNDSLIQEIDKKEWKTDLKRRTQHYGYTYDYKSKKVDTSMFLGDLPDFIKPISNRLKTEGFFKVEPDQLIINEYLPGQGIAAHIDCIPCFDSQIGTISLGWAYEMDFLHLDGERSETILLPVGSLVIMNGESRYSWLHRIKSKKEDQGIKRQRRLSLTFRNVIIT